MENENTKVGVNQPGDGFSRVDKKAKLKWRITRTIWLIILAAIILPICFGIMSDEGGDSAISILAWICGGVILLLQLINIVVYPIIEYIQWAYKIGDDCIEIKKGIFWKSHTVIPISRIQHVSASSGPIERLLKLSTVVINTAGGQHAIKQLSASVAEQICASLQNVVNKKVTALLAKTAALTESPVAAEPDAVTAPDCGGDAQ